MYLLPKTPIFRVPDDLPDSVAVLTEIMAVTHGVETAQSLLGLTGGYRFGNSVAVLGVGPLGLCHLIKARLLGAAKLIATDLFPSRLAPGGGIRRNPDDASGPDRTGRTHRSRTRTH